jgi:hypothetical protein
MMHMLGDGDLGSAAEDDDTYERCADVPDTSPYRGNLLKPLTPPLGKSATPN